MSLSEAMVLKIHAAKFNYVTTIDIFYNLTMKIQL